MVGEHLNTIYSNTLMNHFALRDYFPLNEAGKKSQLWGIFYDTKMSSYNWETAKKGDSYDCNKIEQNGML